MGSQEADKPRIISLLCDQSTTYGYLNYGTGTPTFMQFDLAGHTLTVGESSGEREIAIASGGKLICMNTGDKQGDIAGTVVVKGTLTIPAENDLKFETVSVKSGGSASLAAGEFGTITVTSGVKLADLLEKYYCFVDASGVAMFTQNETELTNVTVQPCKHEIREVGGKYQCPCDDKVVAASVSKNGTTTPYLEENLQEAFNAVAGGGTIRLLVNGLPAKEGGYDVPGGVTIDLSGTSCEPDCSLNICGEVTIISKGTDYYDNDGVPLTQKATQFKIPITVKSGETLIVPEKYDTGTDNLLSLQGNIVIEDGGKAQLDAKMTESHTETVDRVYGFIYVYDGGEVSISTGKVGGSLVVHNGGTATITDGEYGSLVIGGSDCTVKILNGSFDTIRIDERNQITGNKYQTVGYADFIKLLEEGKAYQKTSGNWISNGVEDSLAGSAFPHKVISNVKVAQAPTFSVAISGEKKHTICGKRREADGEYPRGYDSCSKSYLLSVVSGGYGWHKNENRKCYE